MSGNDINEFFQIHHEHDEWSFPEGSVDSERIKQAPFQSYHFFLEKMNTESALGVIADRGPIS